MPYPKGKPAWNRGLHWSDEVKKKISESNRGKISCLKGTKGIKKPSAGSFKKGHAPWNKGKKYQTKKRPVNICKGCGKETENEHYCSINCHLETHNPSKTVDVKDRLRAAWTPVRKMKTSERAKAYWTPERRQYFSKKNPLHSPEIIAKRNISLKKSWTSERRLEMSQRRKLFWTQEEKDRQSKRFFNGACPSKRPEVAKKISTAIRGKYIGKDNPNWKGGIAFLPYCPKFNNRLKEQIRNRDNRTCQLCGEKENGKKLRVHHIHYDKPNCNPDLISLCHSCHSKVNFNRGFWEEFFIFSLWVRGII